MDLACVRGWRGGRLLAGALLIALGALLLHEVWRVGALALGVALALTSVSGYCPVALPSGADHAGARRRRLVELERLHRQALERDYDLRVCNPAHGPFYGLMARYKESADDPAALRALAEETAMWSAWEGLAPEMRAAYDELGELARWRVDGLGRAAGLVQEREGSREGGALP